MCTPVRYSISPLLYFFTWSVTQRSRKYHLYGLWYYSAPRWIRTQDLQSLGFLKKCIGILENHSRSLSFSLSLQEKRGIEKKRETQNDSLECQYIYSKSLGSALRANTLPLRDRVDLVKMCIFISLNPRKFLKVTS